MILALLACATMPPVAPADAWAPMAPDVDDATAGDPPCVPGSWSVSCPGCTPPWSRTVVVTCVGEGPASWEADLVERALEDRGGLAALRAAGAGEDWSIIYGGE